MHVNHVIQWERRVTIAGKKSPTFTSKLKSFNMNSPTAASAVVIPFETQPALDSPPSNTVPGHKYPDSPFPAAKTRRVESARFASALAHEVRNPLTNINLSIDMLNSAITDNELKIYVDIITRSSARINYLVNELLQYTEIEESETNQHSLHQLLDEVLASTADRILLKKIRVRKEYGAEDGKICVDKEKIGIALTNIIINAIEAMSGQNGELTLVTRSIGNKYVIEIADNGTGIKNEQLQDIFKPHFTNKPGGMGLGLSATLEILQYNHVVVDVSSEEGHGTCFILFFDKVI
jgi:signal transduction histidine kinase